MRVVSTLGVVHGTLCLYGKVGDVLNSMAFDSRTLQHNFCSQNHFSPVDQRATRFGRCFAIVIKGGMVHEQSSIDNGGNCQ